MATEAVNLAAETRSAPKTGATNYQAIAPGAELVGGGEVFLSRNRKAVAKWVPGEARPMVYVTSEVGTVQQSVPYRAVGTALVHDVIPIGQVLSLYAENGRVGELIARMVADHRDDFVLALADNADVLAEVAALAAEDEAEDAAEVGADANPDAEVQPEDLAL